MNVSELTDGACLRVPLSMLVDAPWGNVRKGKRNPANYEELKQSIQIRGVVQSVAVRPNDTDNTLEVLAGYGRRDASREVGRDDIPVVIKRVDDKEGIAIGLAENLQREDLNIVDAIRIAQQFISLHDGDYEEASKAVGWDVRVLKGRLKLNDCTEKVLDALESGTIGIGHAEVLSQFTAGLQDNTLELIVNENWTIGYLKERANKASRVLRHAKFDTTECDTCPHNSDVQSSLFDNHIGVGKCGNLPCFREKTDSWLAEQKTQLEKEEGMVLLAIEKPLVDRRTVGPDSVGEDAFNDDCLGCVSRVRILQDGINKGCGDVTDNQCINLSCFRAKVEALKQVETNSKSKSKNSGGTKKADAKRKSPAPRVSNSVKTQSEQFARGVVGNALLKVEGYQQALILAALCQMTGYRPKGDSAAALHSRIAKMAGWGAEQLAAEITNAMRHGTTECEQGSASFDGTRVVLGAAGHIPNAREQIIEAWAPTKAWLETYQKGAIEGFCRQKAVGFAAAFNEEHDAGAFEKLMKQKKDTIIETILAFKFDWGQVAPKELLDLVK